MAIFDREHEPPKASTGDLAHAAADAVASLVPAGSQLFNFLLSAPLERRRDEWMNEVAAKLRELSAKGALDLATLRDEPAFVDAMLSASQAAIRTSQREKRTALRNAVLNAAAPTAPDVAVQQLFIALVDRMSDWHLLVLRLFLDPGAWTTESGTKVQPTGSLQGVIFQAFPQLRGREDLVDQIWADLRAAGLHRSGELRGMMTPNGTMAKRTSELGDQFLAFISEPDSLRP